MMYLQPICYGAILRHTPASHCSLLSIPIVLKNSQRGTEAYAMCFSCEQSHTPKLGDSVVLILFLMEEVPLL